MPICLGGGDEKENLIDLFAREHFEAHRLLALENPENKKLVYAWWCMSTVKSEYTKERYRVSALEYEEVRVAVSQAMNGRIFSDETRQKMSDNHADVSGKNNPMYGNHKLSGENNHMFGKHHSEETRRKISEANSNPSDETREKMSLSAKNRCTDEFRKNTSEIMKTKWGDLEYRKMMIENHADFSGSNSPRAKLVLCVDTKTVYGAASVASEKTGIIASSIRGCCNGIYKTAGGYQWKFIYDTTRRNGEFIAGAITLGLITESEVEALLIK